MVQPADLTKRDSSSSTATFSSLRSSWRSGRGESTESSGSSNAASGPMASAAAAAQARRRPGLKNSASQPSIRSIASSCSSTDSIKAEKKASRSTRPSAQPRNSFSTVVDRVTQGHRNNSNTSRRTHSSTHSKAKRRSADTVMQCGRHGNEWLFGGWSLRETVKGMLK